MNTQPREPSAPGQSPAGAQRPEAELRRVMRFLGSDAEVRVEEGVGAQNVSRDRLRRSPWRERLMGLPGATTLRRAMRIVSDSRETHFPVVDDEGEMVGIFSLNDLRRIFLEHEVQDIVVARDFMREQVSTVTAEDSLHDVQRLFTRRGVSALPRSVQSLADEFSPPTGAGRRSNYEKRSRTSARLGT